MKSEHEMRLDPLAVAGRDAARLVGVGYSTWRRWDACGRTPRGIRIGGKVLWAVDELRAWVAAGMPSREGWDPLRAREATL